MYEGVKEHSVGLGKVKKGVLQYLKRMLDIPNFLSADSMLNLMAWVNAAYDIC